MSESSVFYLYGFVPRGTGLPRLTGVEERSEVSLIELADVACAVSQVPATEYQREPGTLEPSEQLSWITPRAWWHHEVVRRLHAAGAVVPLKFGTLCPGIEDVHAMLRALHVPLADLLARFDGKDEWTLRATANTAAWTDRMQATEPALIAMKNEERGLPEGRAYFARKKLQAATADLIGRQVEIVEETIHARLSLAGVEIAPAHRTRAAAAAGDLEIAEAAVLVDRSRFAGFEALLAQLEDEHAAWPLRIELVGPWAPYSFATTVEPLRIVS
jgi:hypothetical protein